MAPPEESTETLNQEESTETENQGSEESTGTENQETEESTETENQETDGETTEKPINQEAVNKRINKLTFEKHEEQRKREDLEAKYAELQAEIEKQKQSSSEIVIPDMPDPYDPEFASKLAEREKAVQEKARADAAREVAEQAHEAEVKRRQEEAVKQFEQQTTKMFDSGEKAGITREDLQKAEQTVSMFVRDPSLAQFILAQEDSALIVHHLANNVSELEQVVGMSPMNAAAYIATVVTPKAKEFKPQQPGAPAPLNVPKGGPAPNQDPYLKGVQFE